MSNRLSYSAISTYSQCGEKYRLRYKERLKSKFAHGALVFGSAIDGALNTLLISKDLNKAILEFDKLWAFQYVNGDYVSLSRFPDLVYAETDYDEDLLLQEDKDKINLLKHDRDDVLSDKKAQGWGNLSSEAKADYNFTNWCSMRRKGHIMLNSYYSKILPRIREVLAVQKENVLENSTGDSIVQYLDLVVTWEDGRNVLMDNKTSARDYEDDSAARSPQLISYYHGVKEEYKLSAVGFIVLKKNILKNKMKICSICAFDGSGSRHQKCNNEESGTRCNGEWNVRIDPECYIQVIVNDVTETAEDLVLSTFDQANEGIQKEYYPKNLGACKQGPITCDYYNLCWFGNKEDLVVSSGSKK